MSNTNTISEVIGLLTKAKALGETIASNSIKEQTSAKLNSLMQYLQSKLTPVAQANQLPLQQIPADYVPTPENATKGRCCS